MIIAEYVNVPETACVSGYNDISHFSKSFKKQFNMSPKQFQKEPKKENFFIWCGIIYP